MDHDEDLSGDAGADRMNEKDVDQVIEIDDIRPEGYESDDENVPTSSNASAMGEPEIVDDSTMALQAHAQDCFSIAIAGGRWLASGGEDDVAFLWDNNVSDSDPVLKVQHADSVTTVLFNSAETLLATADMSGKIIITQINNLQTRAEINDCSDLEWVHWHQTSDILFAGDRDGMVWMWLIGPQGVVQSKVYSSSGSPCTAGCLLSDGRRLLAGYADGTVRLWLLREQTHSQIVLPSAVTVIQHHQTQPIAIIGTQQGSVVIVNTSQADNHLKKVSEIPPLADANQEDDPEEDVNQCVESLALATSHPWVAVGRNDGSLCVYETFSASPRSIYKSPNLQAINKVIWTMEDATPFLSAASVDGTIRVFDGRDGSLFKELGNGGDDILDMVVLGSNPLRLMTAGAGGVIRMFDITQTTS